MKILFIDNDEVLVVPPDKLKLSQVSPNVSALGVMIKEEGEEAKFVPLINFNINLVMPVPEPIPEPITSTQDGTLTMDIPNPQDWGEQ